MSGFKELSERLVELEDLPSRITREVSDGINEQIRQSFDTGTDPYGAPWKPLSTATVRRKRGDTRILRRTDRLSNETVASPSGGSGIEITSVDYGGVHQAGSTLPKRAILPDGPDLPKAWQAIIQEATERAFAKAMKR